MDISELGPPDLYGPTWGQRGTGHAWATWYSEDYDEEGENVSVHWKPAADTQTEPAYEVVRWTRKGGRTG